MAINQIIKQIMTSTTIDVSLVNLYLKLIQDKSITKDDIKRLRIVFKDKLEEFNIPFSLAIIDYFDGYNYKYFNIDEISDILEISPSLAIIIGRKKGNTVNRLFSISNYYQDAESYEAFMNDYYCFNNPSYYNENVTEKEEQEYEIEKINSYKKFAEIINTILDYLRINVKVSHGEGWDGILTVPEDSTIYISGNASEIVSLYESLSDFKFDFLLVHDSTPYFITISRKDGDMKIDCKKEFSTILGKHDVDIPKEPWKQEELSYYNHELGILRYENFSLQSFESFLWHLSFPPYVTREKYYYERPLLIAAEKIAEVLNIPYDLSLSYVQEYNKSIRKYTAQLQVAMDYPENAPSESLDEYLIAKQVKLAILLKK